MILEVSSKPHCKLDKILGNFYSELFLSITKLYHSNLYYKIKVHFFHHTIVLLNKQFLEIICHSKSNLYDSESNLSSVKIFQLEMILNMLTFITTQHNWNLLVS